MSGSAAWNHRGRARRSARLFVWLGLMIGVCGCGEGDSRGAKLFPERVGGVVCSARTGAPIVDAKVIVAKWIGTAFDESPSVVRATTGADGRFEVNVRGARRVEVEIGAEKFHPCGWVFSGRERFCLEPVSVRAMAEIRTFRVGFDGGKPFGFRFASASETKDASLWDIGPTTLPAVGAPISLEFRGLGGSLGIDEDSSLMGQYFFGRNFEVPNGSYERELRVLTTGACKEGRCWYFQDATGGSYGKARLKSFETGRDRERDWSLEFEYVYAQNGERHLEPKWRAVVARYPESK